VKKSRQTVLCKVASITMMSMKSSLTTATTTTSLARRRCARPRTTRASSASTRVTFVRVTTKSDEDSMRAFMSASAFNASLSIKEMGNLRFDALRSEEQPNEFTLVEIYADDASVAQHKETKHYLQWRDDVADLMMEPRTAETYEPIYPDDATWQGTNAVSWNPEDECDLDPDDAQVTHVYVKVKPGSEAAFAACCVDNASNSALEPDNLRFDVFQSAEDSTRFVLVEVYANADAVRAHKETDHYLKWRDSVASMMAEPRSATRYSVIFPQTRVAWRGDDCEDACEMNWSI